MTYIPHHKRGILTGGQKLALGMALLALLCAILSMFTGPAHADTFVYERAPGYFRCTRGVGCEWGNGAPPQYNVRHVDPVDNDEADQRWLEECQPKLTRDKLGVMRYLYAKPGCEYGSPE
jgi:hypothetical protein